MQFEWDTKKAASNLKKHRVSFEEAVSVFNDLLAETVIDPDHSEDESRLITIGTSEHGRLLFVSHADRGRSIRVISARSATPKERREYENKA